MHTGIKDSRKLYNDGITKTVTDAEQWQLKTNRLVPVFDGSCVLHDYAHKLYQCGSFLAFGEDDEGRAAIAGANFCRVRWCPMCQWRRSTRLFVELSGLWDSLREAGFEFLHVVLTVRNCSADDLPQLLDRMQAAYRNMIHDPRLKGWKGAMRFTEVTVNPNKSPCQRFHPHFHSLVVVRSSYFHSRWYVSSDTLRRVWGDCLGVDYAPQVFIAKADSKAINEVAKYCVKPFGFEQDNIDEERLAYEQLYSALAGRRLYQAFGSVRSAAQLVRQLDDPEAAPVVRRDAFTYDYGRAHYVPAEIGSPS